MKIPILIVFSLICVNGCISANNLNEQSKERAQKQLDDIDKEYKKTHAIWEATIYNVISIGMPRNDFEINFSKYIFKKEVDRIYFYEPETRNKSRVTFLNGKLVKYERYGKYYGGIGPGLFFDQSFLLKN